MKVLVTGGTGYLGRAVVGALSSRGHEVALFARTASGSGLAGRAFDSADAIRDLGYMITPLADGIRETVKSLSPPDRIGSR